MELWNALISLLTEGQIWNLPKWHIYLAFLLDQQNVQFKELFVFVFLRNFAMKGQLSLPVDQAIMVAVTCRQL